MKKTLVILALLIPVLGAEAQKKDMAAPDADNLAMAAAVVKDRDPVNCDALVELADSVINFGIYAGTGLFYPVQVTHYTYDSNYNLTQILVISLPSRTNVLRQVFEYDTDNQQIKYTNYNWTAGAWDMTLFVERSYNANNEIVTEVYSKKESDGTFQPYMRHFYTYNSGVITNYLRQMKNTVGVWYDFSYHNYVYDYLGRLTVLYGQYINGPVFWERTAVYGTNNYITERYLRQLKYDPVLKQNVLTNIVFEDYSRNIYGDVSEILYHGWVNNEWVVNGKAIYYYSLIKGKKVAICHNGRTLCVPAELVAQRLAQGATLGECPVTTNAITEEPILPAVQEFTLFPNPASENITISLSPGDHEFGTGYLIAPGGRIVDTFDATGKSEIVLNVSSLKPGSYYIRINSPGAVVSQTFIKK